VSALTESWLELSIAILPREEDAKREPLWYISLWLAVKMLINPVPITISSAIATIPSIKVMPERVQPHPKRFSNLACFIADFPYLA
jgi:hypothetical protein